MVAPPAVSILYGVRTILPNQRFVAPTSGYHLAYGQFDIGRSRALETTSRRCDFGVQHPVWLACGEPRDGLRNCKASH
jgi:hypothetical protein